MTPLLFQSKRSRQPASDLVLLIVVVASIAAPDAIPASPSGEHDVPQKAQSILREFCFDCHSAAKRKGGLRLDSREKAFQGGESKRAAIVPGNGGQSEMMRRLESTDRNVRMPPNGPRPDPGQTAILREWIDTGAQWPERLDAASLPLHRPRELAVTKADRQHWAFRPLDLANLGTQRGNPIDRYFGHAISPRRAPRESLIRRITFGLHGLPPSPEDITRFVEDPAPNAYERLVDRLLASPRYGERWGRHWLDVARYADSDGYESDLDRSHAWPYRDWVIRALNQDLPFDTFAKWQIAGDEYAPTDPQAVIATGFLAAGPWRTTTPADTEENKQKIRYDQLDDMLSTTSSAFLGLTVGCARCHDHKFDPIPTRDYYRMLSAFVTSERRTVSLSKPRREFDQWKQRQSARWREWKMQQLNLTEEERFWLRQPEHFFVPISVKLFKAYGEQLRPDDQDLFRWLETDQQSIWHQFQSAIRSDNNPVSAIGQALVVTDRQHQVAPSFLLSRGEVMNPSEPVSLGFLQILTGTRTPHDYRRSFWPDLQHDQINRKGFIRPKTTYQRAALAEWMTDVPSGAGALLARVAVNRIWQHHFGQGFSTTPNDFGTRGASPDHPELLETLAATLVQSEWRLKPIHKLVLMSQRYQAPQRREGRPVRLEAEILRDAMLLAAGKLNLAMDGPPFKPPIPKAAISTRSQDAYPANLEDGPDRWRRSLYAFSKRSVPNPVMEIFDAPNADASCGRRNVTTVAPQALTLLNNPQIRGWARDFATRVRRDVGPDHSRQVKHAYQIALSRLPGDTELEEAIVFLRHSELENLCHLLFTLNEFIYVD